ncbi:hypothetical protein A3K64_01160 [Candidatus Micrarchaeota archaeon RBG_16_36_9]|nr:MAG: hypothetical protein A3K64_01160 [Candidatus Micrarchaeota archaeon RBG_16_36_9]
MDPLPIAFAVIIMVLMLLVTVGFVSGKTDIDFAKLWEGQVPGTDFVSEGDFDNNPNPQYKINDIGLDHIFTAQGGPHDLSEIACYIGDTIYEDFKKNGENNPGTLCEERGWPFYKNKQVCLVGSPKSFIYQSGTIDLLYFGLNEQKMSSRNCHICAAPVGDGNGVVPDLDQTCIDLQLKDRIVDSLDFCTHSLSIDGKDTRFGNCNDDGTPSSNSGNNDWDNANDNSCGNNNNEFCDNGRDRIAWYVANGVGDSYQDFLLQDNNDNFNSKVMFSGKRYVMGIFWVPDDNGYGVTFAMDPTQNPSTIDYNGLIDYIGSTGNVKRRHNVLGELSSEARASAAFYFTPTDDDLKIIDLRTAISSKLGTSLEKVIFCNINSIDSDKCPPNLKATTSESCNIGLTPNADITFKDTTVRIVSNATNEAGGAVTSNTYFVKNKKYEVIVEFWADEYKKCSYDLWGNEVPFSSSSNGRIIHDCGMNTMITCFKSLYKNIYFLEIS